MLTRFFRKIFKRNNHYTAHEISPHEIFLDSSNLPEFDTSQFEGRLEKPIGRLTILILGVFFAFVGFVYAAKVWVLQVKHGEAYALRSENNRLRHVLIFSDRGVVYDRNNVPLAWNDINIFEDFSMRKYATSTGFSHVLGYLKYPSKDTSGFYYSTAYEGQDGVEKFYDSYLSGENGIKIIETDALNKVKSENIIHPPQSGNTLALSVDARVEHALYDRIESLANDVGFEGGAGVIMDIKTGEIIAMTSFPEYSSQVLGDGEDANLIKKYLEDKQKPFLDRATSGLYTPGSIVKPFMALAALNEKIIDPYKQILSTGSISIPNPYDPKKKSVFNDWKAHGYVDMRHALAVSSDVYFYEIGGGFEDQKGLGINNIDKYMKLFGFGETVPGEFFGDKKGVVPTPAWKLENFDGEPWRVGDTYNTSIGQYGFQVTPLQVVRGAALIANNGLLLDPTILLFGNELRKFSTPVEIPKEYFAVVKDGMRLSVLQGTAAALNTPDVEIAAKTGTAELGTAKKFVNSWVMGFFPYQEPRYAFAVVMEKGPVHNLFGAPFVMRGLIDWMAANTPEYLK